MGRKCEFKVKESASLASSLAVSVAGLSRGAAYALISSGEVKVNGARVKTNIKLAAGDTVSVFVPDAVSKKVTIEPIYSDDNIAVFDKPKHMTFDAIPEAAGEKLLPVHRLDTNTTGLIIFAKTEDAKARIEGAFKDRRTVKVYDAVVCPPPKAEKGIFTAYTAMGDNAVASVSGRAVPGYKTMITEYETAERIGRAALLKVTLHTGRTHQIRAHLKFLGCPIVGDPKYGGEHIEGAPSTQMLAAVSLRLDGLGGGLEYLNGMTFTAPNHFDTSFLLKN